MGRAHVEAFRQIPGVEVAGIADEFPQGAELAREFGVPFTGIYDELIGRDDIDAITVGLPHTLHRSVTVKALASGKHVLCEKPLASTLSDCDRMIRAATKAGRILMPGQTHRFWPANVKVKEILDSGVIGQPIMARDWINWAGFYPGYPQWLRRNSLAGGGILLDNGVHSVDRLRYWLGGNVESVTARLGRYVHDIEGEDNGAMLLSFDNGTFATVVESWTYPRYATECAAEITCTRGAIRVNTWGSIVLCKSGTTSAEEVAYPVVDGFLDQMREFVSAIQEGRQPRVTAMDGRAAVEAILAAYRSQETGETVRLPLSSRANRKLCLGVVAQT